LEPGNYKIKIRESNATYWSLSKISIRTLGLLWIKDGKFVSNLTGIELPKLGVRSTDYKTNLFWKSKKKPILDFSV
jgi:hypothetical protein